MTTTLPELHRKVNEKGDRERQAQQYRASVEPLAKAFHLVSKSVAGKHL